MASMQPASEMRQGPSSSSSVMPLEVVIAPSTSEGALGPPATNSVLGNPHAGDERDGLLESQGPGLHRAKRIHPTPLEPARRDWLGPARTQVCVPFAPPSGGNQNEANGSAEVKSSQCSQFVHTDPNHSRILHESVLQEPSLTEPAMHPDPGPVIDIQVENETQHLESVPVPMMDPAPAPAPHMAPPALVPPRQPMVMYNEPQPELVLSKPAPKLKPTVKDEDLSPAELLMRGGSLWKIACNPTVHTGIAKRKWFKIVIPRGAGPDEALLEWHDPERAHKRPRSIPMNRVVKVLTGHQTKPFFAMQACDLPPARLSFSLLLPERSLDLAALREEDLKIWLEGLCYYACNASVKQIRTADLHVDSGSITFSADGRSEHKQETASEEILFDLFDAAYENEVIAFEQILGGNNFDVDTLEPGVAYGDSCLVIASQRGYTKIAEICLRYGAVNDPHPDYGQTALQAAVSRGQMVCAKLLLETAAPSKMDTVIVNETDQKGSAPIHLACHLKDRNLIQLLLKHGADMTIVDKKGRTVLHCAILTRTAAQKGRAQETVQCLRMLLDQGADEFVNVQDDSGNTALHFAVQTGNAEIVRVLLESAGNPLITNADGFQPYHVAISRNATACLTLLREYESWFSAHEAATASRRAATSKMDVYSSTCAQSQTMHEHEHGASQHSHQRQRWQEHYTDDGYPYYVNEWTGESQWEDPQVADASCLVQRATPFEVGAAHYLESAGLAAAAARHHESSSGQLALREAINHVASLDDPQQQGQLHAYHQQVNQAGYEHVQQPQPQQQRAQGVGERLRHELYRARKAQRGGSLAAEQAEASSLFTHHPDQVAQSRSLCTSKSRRRRSKRRSGDDDVDDSETSESDREDTNRDDDESTEGDIVTERHRSKKRHGHHRKERQRASTHRTSSRQSGQSRRTFSDDESDQTSEDDSSVQSGKATASRGNKTLRRASKKGKDAAAHRAAADFENDTSFDKTSPREILDAISSHEEKFSSQEYTKEKDEVIGTRVDQANAATAFSPLETSRAHDGNEKAKSKQEITVTKTTALLEEVKKAGIARSNKKSEPKSPLNDAFRSLQESKADDATSTVGGLAKYVQMRKFGIAEAAVRQKMLMDGITDAAAIAKVLATPAQQTTETEPESKKAALTKALSERGVGRKTDDEGGKVEVVAHNGPSAEEAMEKLEAMECFGKYKKMKKMGIPPPAIKQKMMKDGLSNDVVTLFEIAFKIAAPPAPPSGKRPTNRRSRSVLKLHWNTLQVDSVENTVWATKASTAALPDEDLKDLEELFAAKKATKKVLTSSTRLVENPKRRSTVSSKRENNVGIGLAQFRKAFASMDEIGLAIDAADAERLGGARAQLLLDLLPDAEETRELERALSRMSEASFLEEATPVERFFVSILKISQVKRKVQGIVFEQQFGDLQKELETRLGTMLRGCEEIQSSKRLQQVFKMILDIGNYMNEGDEAGFTLDSLLKLGETRAADRKTTVIDYLCKVAHRKGGDELLHVDDELKSIEAASKLLPSDLLQRAKKLASDLDNAERLIASEEENDAASVYAGAMKPRLALIRPQVTALVTRAESMIAATRDAVSYFGENPDACTPQHMLKVLHKFLLLFRDSRRKFLHKLKLERRRQDKLDAQAAQSR